MDFRKIYEQSLRENYTLYGDWMKVKDTLSNHFFHDKEFNKAIIEKEDDDRFRLILTN